MQKKEKTNQDESNENKNKKKKDYLHILLPKDKESHKTIQAY